MQFYGNKPLQSGARAYCIQKCSSIVPMHETELNDLLYVVYVRNDAEFRATDFTLALSAELY